LICVLAFNALRIKTRCVLDKEEGVVLVEEQSYTRRLRERFPIEDARAVVVRRLPAAPLVGNAVTYGLFLGLTSSDYLVASGTNEQAVSQDAWRISRFLDLPLEQQETDEAAPIRTRRGVLATA